MGDWLCLLCGEVPGPGGLQLHLQLQHRVSPPPWQPPAAPRTRLRCMFCLAELWDSELQQHVTTLHRIPSLYLGILEEAEEGGGGGGLSINSCNSSEDAEFEAEEDNMEQSQVEEVDMNENQEYSHASVSISPPPPCPTLPPTSPPASPCLLPTPPPSTNDAVLPLQQTPKRQLEPKKNMKKQEKKKVTFADLTNFFPTRKRRFSKGIPPMQILGANTTLKYLKYWGTPVKPPVGSETGKPSAREVKLKPTRPNKKLQASTVEDSTGGEGTELGVRWRCPACPLTAPTVRLVREHARLQHGSASQPCRQTLQVGLGPPRADDSTA